MLRHPLAMPLLIALLVALAWLPGLRAGFMADDHFLFFSLGQLPATAPLHNLFALVGSAEEVRVYRECGLLPWWTSDDMRLVFWRPVSSLTHWLDWRHDAATHFALAWVVTGLALVTTTFPDPRLLFVASMGFAVIVGRLAEMLWAVRTDWRPARSLLGALVALHLVVAPAVTQASLAVVRSLPESTAEVLEAVDAPNLPPEVTEVFFLNWNQPATSPIAELWLIDQLPPVPRARVALKAPGVPYTERVEQAFAHLPATYRTLSYLPEVELEELDAHTLRLSSPRGDFFPSVFEKLYLTSSHFTVGQQAQLSEFTATVDAMAGERVTAVRFTFDEPLQSQRYRFLRWRDGRWEVVHFDAVAARSP